MGSDIEWIEKQNIGYTANGNSKKVYSFSLYSLMDFS